jgi:hypothetical protein
MLWPLLHWLAIHTGTYNEPGPYYGFWSGFGSDLGEYAIVVSLLAGLFHTVRKHNCHMPGCWRIGRHSIEGTTYVVCRKHHPEDHQTVRDAIKDAAS